MCALTDFLVSQEPSGERLIEIAGNPDQMAAAEAAILPYATGEPPNAFY